MFCYEIAVRYGECDLQGVVFNAHYLAYCDHAMDELLRAAVGDDADFELMLKSAQLTWHTPLRYRDVVAIDCSVTRWGTSSMDVRFAATVAGQARFDALITYVAVDTSVDPAKPTPIPDDVRAAFTSATNPATAPAPAAVPATEPTPTPAPVLTTPTPTPTPAGDGHV